MSVSARFRDYVLEQLAGSGRVSAKAMFGGVGLYLDGLFFALLADDTLYLKTDDANRPRFEQAGSHPFCPYPGRPDQTMGYWSAPSDVLEDPHQLAQWAREAAAVALRARAAKPARRHR